MNKKLYYEVDFCRCKTSTEKTMNRKFAEDGDCIEWYNDGKNIFFGGASCGEAEVMTEILYNIGVIKLEFCMWGI